MPRPAPPAAAAATTSPGPSTSKFDYSGFRAKHQDVEFDVVDTSGKGTMVWALPDGRRLAPAVGHPGLRHGHDRPERELDPSHDYVLLVSGGPNFDKDLIVKTDKDGNPVMGEDGKPLKVAWQLVDLVG